MTTPPNRLFVMYAGHTAASLKKKKFAVMLTITITVPMTIPSSTDAVTGVLSFRYGMRKITKQIQNARISLAPQ